MNRDEALERYTTWEKSIPSELAHAFKPIPVAWRSWRPYILNHLDDARLTNAFTESMNAKIRKMYRDGHGYSFEALRAKVLFSDQLQKRARVQERTREKRKRFNELSDRIMYIPSAARRRMNTTSGQWPGKSTSEPTYPHYCA